MQLGEMNTDDDALREAAERLVRMRALERLGEMADRGDFDEFASNKSTYRG